MRTGARPSFPNSELGETLGDLNPFTLLGDGTSGCAREGTGQESTVELFRQATGHCDLSVGKAATD